VSQLLLFPVVRSANITGSPLPSELSCRVEEIEDALPSEEAPTSVLNTSSFDLEAIPPARRLKRKFNIAFDEGLPKRHALGALLPRPKCPDWVFPQPRSIVAFVLTVYRGRTLPIRSFSNHFTPRLLGFMNLQTRMWLVISW